MNSALKETPVGPNETLSIFPWYFQLNDSKMTDSKMTVMSTVMVYGRKNEVTEDFTTAIKGRCKLVLI